MRQTYVIVDEDGFVVRHGITSSGLETKQRFLPKNGGIHKVNGNSVIEKDQKITMSLGKPQLESMTPEDTEKRDKRLAKQASDNV